MTLKHIWSYLDHRNGTAHTDTIYQNHRRSFNRSVDSWVRVKVSQTLKRGGILSKFESLKRNDQSLTIVQYTVHMIEYQTGDLMEYPGPDF